MDVHKVAPTIRAVLPEGGALPNEIWQRRHRGIVVLLCVHVVAIPIYGFVRDAGLAHAIMEGSVVAAAALIASRSELNRKLRSAAATFGLFSSSAILVHLSGGLIEMHFHFFVMVAVVTLYQDWLPFLLGIGYVLLHHGFMGWLAPQDVYNHPAAINHPWKWASIHALFIAAESAALLVAWHLGEEGFEDPLTKLSNRTLFSDRLNHALSRSRRNGEGVSVAFLDLDGFKDVNDSLGHHAGDELLVAVAHRLSGCLRGADTAARLGGDEFALLLEATDDIGATTVAKRIQAALQEPFQLHGQDVGITASIGIASSRPETEEAGELMRNADAAMYVAKSKGKARYECFAPSMHVAVVNRLQLETELKHAIKNQEFTLQYQPIVELMTGRISSLEALVRWDHPERGLVPPMDFVPAAEETGLIGDLGRYVLQQACHQVRLWQQQFPSDPPLKATVNLSAKQLEDPHLAPDVVATLRDSELPPETLILEITETVLMQDSESAAAKLHELKALGVQLAIDDFGTGYSSLSYLRRFPIDIFKIDRSFVNAMDNSVEGTALPAAIVALGRSLKLKTIAEGIETPQQLQGLQDISCDYAQGYYFTRPLWPTDLVDLLEKKYMDVNPESEQDLQPASARA